MHSSRRSMILPAVTLLAAATLISGCGVKGALEQPAEPAPALSAQPAGTAQASRKVFTEESSVISRSNHDILPQMPPKEWEKQREYQPARDKGKAPAVNTRREPDPGKAFILDWLL